jgi:hypothetical protein
LFSKLQEPEDLFSLWIKKAENITGGAMNITANITDAAVAGASSSSSVRRR